jgi:hypothetical protein
MEKVKIEQKAIGQASVLNSVLKSEVLKLLQLYSDCISQEQKKLVYCSICKNKRIQLNIMTKAFETVKDIASDLVNEAIANILEDKSITYKSLFNKIAIYYYNTTEKQEKKKADIMYADNIARDNNEYLVAEITEKDLYMIDKARKNLKHCNYHRVKNEMRQYFIDYNETSIQALLNR